VSESHDRDHEPHDQDEAIEQARRELDRAELEQAVDEAEGAADLVAQRVLLRWALVLLGCGLLAAALVSDSRFLLVALLLAILCTIPFVIAGLSTEWGEALRRSLTRRLRGPGGREPGPQAG
jgi:hypothetical protein